MQEIQCEYIEHNSRDKKYRQPFGAVEAGQDVQLGIFVRLFEPVTEAVVRVWQDGKERVIGLSDEGGGLWRAELSCPESGLVWYYFRLRTATRTIYYGNNDEQRGGIGTAREGEPPSFQITVYERGAKTPDWFKNGIVYQIFPDRFYHQGEGFPVRKGAVFHTDWNDTPYYFRDGITREVLAYDFFGGNLAGIREKLPYLADLGITVIYLNPIFEAESNHRYDTGDYHKIDSLLGDETEFAGLLAEAGKMGIKVVLDGVFSHTGSNSRYFNQKGEYESIGAVQSIESPYYKWYKFKNYPNEYEAWWGVRNLPEVNEEEASYLDFVVENEDSVLNHWQKLGLGGWRLDVLDELPENFLRAFYRQLKANDKEAVLIGEVWEDASNKISYGTPRKYLCGGETDGVMNYPLRSIMLDFLLGLADGREAMDRIESLRENYPPQNFYALLNVLGTHDVERLLTVLGGGIVSENLPDSLRGTARLTDQARDLAVKRLKLITLWQFMFPGVPSVYYGDEAGMEGQKDPFNRGTFPWENIDKEIFGWYKELIRLRKGSQALKTGQYIPLYGQGDLLAFARRIGSNCHDEFDNFADEETFVVVINRSARELAATIDISQLNCGELFEYDICFGGTLGKAMPAKELQVTVSAYGMKIFRAGASGNGSRSAGILLHISSLPSQYGIGDIGKNARAFIDFLAEAGQKVWQILPLHPVDLTGSPYQSNSAFAGNLLLIDPEWLYDKQLLTAAELEAARFDGDKVDFCHVQQVKDKLLRQAFSRLTAEWKVKIAEFVEQERYWLPDYALYQAGKKANGNRSWVKWNKSLRDRDENAIAELKEAEADEIAFTEFTQYVFSRQWADLRDHAAKKGVRLFGDMPLFIAADSADVWSGQNEFALAEDGMPSLVAGVPPDYFSKTGQLWGNPQYSWEQMADNDFAWWKKRIKRQLELVDIIRIDHFRGLEAYWEIQADEKTAENGRWVKAPGKALLTALKESLGQLPLVAEDLGIITAEVNKLRETFNLPGMKVLEFELLSGETGFGPTENTVAYTGTHDNNTLLGWYEDDLSPEERERVRKFTGETEAVKVCRELIRRIYESTANLVILPLQDVLLMPGCNRLNTPGTVENNWCWRLKNMPEEKERQYLSELCKKYCR